MLMAGSFIPHAKQLPATSYCLFVFDSSVFIWNILMEQAFSFSPVAPSSTKQCICLFLRLPLFSNCISKTGPCTYQVFVGEI